MSHKDPQITQYLAPMGSFTEMLLDFNFRPDVPDVVMAAFASARRGDLGPDLPPPRPVEPGWEWDYPSYYEEEDPRPMWVHDWGWALGFEYEQSYMELTRPPGTSLTWSPERNLWRWSSLCVIKGGPSTYLRLVDWIGAFASPGSTPSASQVVGHFRFDEDPRPIPIHCDGERFFAPGVELDD